MVLGGSAATGDADVFSGCDLFVFGLAATERRPRGRSGGPGEPGSGPQGDAAPGRPLAAGPGDGGDTAAASPAADARPEPWLWHNVRGAGIAPYRYAVFPLAPFAAAAAKAEDGPLYLVRHARILHDPSGAVAAAFREAWAAAAPRMPDRLAARYRAFRQRRASLAWSLRRGQPLLVMDNLRLLLEHALSCGYHLQGEPAPPPKWLFGGGLRTAAGRTLREPVLGLLSSLGDLATLGGSLNLRSNRLYVQTGRVQHALEQALAAQGHPVPGLAAQAPAAFAAGDAPERAPRSLPRRPPPVRRPEGL